MTPVAAATRFRLAFLAMSLLVMSLLPARPAAAETVTVFAAGAVKAAVQSLIPAFEAGSGHKVVAEYDTVGALRDRVLKGEKPDILLLSATAVSAVSTLLPPLASASVGKTGVGLGAPAGQPAPSISTTAAFVAALRAAGSIGYADPARGATAGTHVQTILARLGLTEELKARTTVYPSGIVVIDKVEQGQLALGFSQATEIIGHKGVIFIGLLPDEVQLWTAYRMARFGSSDAAVGFGIALTGPAGAGTFRDIGFVPE